MFRVGQKVVCVDDTHFARGYPDEKFPSKGDILTIREIHKSKGGLRFVELVNPPLPYFQGFMECCFLPLRFRPLQEQGMSILRAIAASPKKELETA